ncbi:MAG: ParB N-terminal domain-containing protein [Planctomycetota bacterium]
MKAQRSKIKHRTRGTRHIPPVKGTPDRKPKTSPPDGVQSTAGLVHVERIAVKKIKLAKYNPRKDLQASDPAYIKLRRSIEQFGCVDTLIWNKRSGHLVGGHQRLKILVAEFGVKAVDVSVVDLPPAEEKALNLALNKITGEWDEQALAALLTELNATASMDATLSGFDAKEIDLAIAEAEAAGDLENTVTQVPVKPYPKTSWTLIGIPFRRHAEVAESIERMAAIEGAVVEVSYSD